MYSVFDGTDLPMKQVNWETLTRTREVGNVNRETLFCQVNVIL